MTTPTVVPAHFSTADTQYLKVKRDNSGAVRGQYTTVTVNASVVTGTIVGLVPFQKGYRFLQGASQLYTAALGTSVTGDIGYVYKTGSTGTDDPDAFGSAITTFAAGGLITFDEFAGLSWVAVDDGWIAVTLGGATTLVTNYIAGQVVGEYDSLIDGQAVN